MNALWNPGDLDRRPHLRLVSTSEERADPLGAGRTALSSGAEASPIPPRRGARLSVEDITDLEQLAILVDRLEACTATLKTAVKRRDVAAAGTAARAVMHVGLLAGERSRVMERRG